MLQKSWTLTEKIPDHLAPYLVRQDPTMYTAIDHASWRFILRISRPHFAKHAHKKYLDGLAETGISTDRIPLISEMDDCLRKFGWRAVAVSGFIPPAAFMEFQSLGVLPIACDMRKLENLAYTPAPDIVHEAAGHAPIITDPEYAHYLRHYGEVSRKAISSDYDLAVYRCIRELSEVKENPDSTSEQIAAAQEQLNRTVASERFCSEAALLARMNWWTVEYGLVGPMDQPKIYGAGLLSSVGESYGCLGPEVKKIPLTVRCVETSYDITRPQPQLFVTPDFRTLSKVLEEFAQTMAFRVGGTEALDKALQAATVTTSELDSKIQIGGKLVEVLTGVQGTERKSPAYLRFEGPSQLGYADREIDGQGARQHIHGFGTPVGKILWKGALRSPASLQDAELSQLTELQFESGVRVQGKVKSTTRREGKLVVLTWEDCTVTLGDRTLFQPEWGVFDMACGTRVASVFGGAPDRGRYLLEIEEFPNRTGFQKTNLTDENLYLNELYTHVRKTRDRGRSEGSLEELNRIHALLDERFPSDWLLRLELLELDQTWKLGAPWRSAVLSKLAVIASSDSVSERLIRRGMELLS